LRLDLNDRGVNYH
jgi:hypothetical protein